ncbi:MAG TPA: Gfo/Idh/MocA family oxidoreductase [Longimicrobiaceae bacterium]|nr:Gfo/Idh/MocA family oxidoreductase [Longimicrobiaceae bacterium]
MPSADPSQPLNLAFLGCGAATKRHSKTLRRLDGDVRRFYASRDLAKAQEFNRSLRGGGAFGSYEDALRDDRIDVVLVATPPASHLNLTLQALDAGKHVIVEKPPFLRAADFDAVQRAQERSGRQVMVAENYYYKPLAERIRQIVASGEIGEVRILSVNALKEQKPEGWRDREELAGGGALFEGGIHWVNFMANLRMPVLAAHGYRPGSDSGPERSIVAVFEYAQGAVGTLYYSWEVRSPLKGLRLSRIFGSHGSLTFESNGLFLLLYGKTRRLYFPRPRDLLGFQAMFRDFFHALRTGAEPHFDLARARRDLELVEEIYQSLNSTSSTQSESA